MLQGVHATPPVIFVYIWMRVAAYRAIDSCISGVEEKWAFLQGGKSRESIALYAAPTDPLIQPGARCFQQPSVARTSGSAPHPPSRQIGHGIWGGRGCKLKEPAVIFVYTLMRVAAYRAINALHFWRLGEADINCSICCPTDPLIQPDARCFLQPSVARTTGSHRWHMKPGGSQRHSKNGVPNAHWEQVSAADPIHPHPALPLIPSTPQNCYRSHQLPSTATDPINRGPFMVSWIWALKVLVNPSVCDSSFVMPAGPWEVIAGIHMNPVPVVNILQNIIHYLGLN